MPSRRLVLIAPLAMGLMGLSQVTVSAPLSTPPIGPAAQAEIDKGIAAAKSQNSKLAITHFNAARKLAPTASVVFLNLGIAEAKVPGRELRAIAWFGAYLNSEPSATNSAAIRAQMIALEQTNRSNTRKFLDLLVATAGKLENAPDPLAEEQVVLALTEFGDVSGALQRAELFSKDPQGKATLVSAIVQEQSLQFDMSGATRTALLLSGRGREFADKTVARFKDLIQKQGILPDPIKRSSLNDASYMQLLGVKLAEARIAKLLAKRNSKPPTDWWLVMLDDDELQNDCPLNTKLFLDLDRHLRAVSHTPFQSGPSTLPSQGQQSFLDFADTAQRMARARNVVVAMMTRQLK